MPNVTLLNDGWSFTLGGGEVNPVTIPHDWLIGDAHNFYTSGVGEYSRKLDLSGIKPGQLVFLRFDGVYMDSELFVNGQKAGEWKYGYTTFEFEITGYISADAINDIRLVVNFDGQSARWYTGAGIYRDVHLIIRNANHFVSDGIYITTALTDGKWTWEADAEVVTDGRAYEVTHTLINPDTEIKPWDINDSSLYTVRSDLTVDGKIEDTVETRIGFRDVKFTTDKGLFVNGNYVKIKGVCLHHDLGSLGAAFSKDAARRQLTIMREMGVNAVRTAHNPPASKFMELCDEMGFLVMSELTDIWVRQKTPGDYSRFFDDWVEKDAASWIRRDRNCPSVILWSVGNEIHDTHIDPEGADKTLRRLLDLVKKHDPKGHAPATLCSNYMTWDNTQSFVDLFKIIGYNYNENLYEPHHKANPDWIIYGGETLSTLQSRDVYHFPLSQNTLGDDDLQCSALGNSTTSWGAESVLACIHDDFNAGFSLGQFLWSGIDYLGEPTPYQTKSCYFGQTDTAGFKKDTYYIFKAAWTDYKEDPFVHIFPYWDFSPGQDIDIRVCSNAPAVALFLDDKQIGKTDIKGKWVADWQLQYKPGILRAEAYDENGNIVAKTIRSSFGDAKSFAANPENYGELDFWTITANDENGKPVENANNRVRISVENGELLALDNGDSTDFESFKSDNKKLFNGKLLAITRRTGADRTRLKVQNDDSDIPVRKVELCLINKDDTGYEIAAKIYPGNSTYDDINWRLTDVGGVDSRLGELIVADDRKSVKIIPKGDGICYVRALPYNGGNHAAFISKYKLELSGFGDSYISPYSFVSATLYTQCNVKPRAGNLRGISTLADKDTHIGFTDLNFGSFGSDEIKMWLFPMNQDPFDFEIWDGLPQNNGKKISTLHYDKGSIWGEYIEATFKLPQRISGISTVCFVFDRKVHVKGFEFTPPDKAFSKLHAAENDGIYGDAFKINGKSVEGIGNNVSIIFDDMDFGINGAGSLKLASRSKLSENSIRIDFTGDKETTTEMITVSGNKDYSENEFKLSSLKYGKNKVTLVFLPGCDIDIEWIIFE
ncbi:MAG: DUF4982 domain-containing protein [Oscillospiraceae bacterium]|nr:DUF4982 domain-containing protein [Oscillospiraceae bacterium]